MDNEGEWWGIEESGGELRREVENRGGGGE